MAGRAEVGRPYLRGRNAGGAELQQNRLLKIKIQVSWTAGPIDPDVSRQIGLGTVLHWHRRLRNSIADPRPNCGEHGLSRHVKLFTHEGDGSRYDSCPPCPFGPRAKCPQPVDWGSKDNGKQSAVMTARGRWERLVIKPSPGVSRASDKSLASVRAMTRLP